MSLIGHLVFAIVMMQVFGAPGDKASTSTIRTPGSSWSGHRPVSSDTIIFPDSKEKEEIILPPPPTLRISPCPNGQKFCDDDDNYPRRQFSPNPPRSHLEKSSSRGHPRDMTGSTVNTKPSPRDRCHLDSSQEIS
ncbi:hypothetical protein GE061_016899 [Apolygus lucorum]|uniref:Uncharacterized protein n=1 Tax=Apolygus lucorum TaxID=248454 RepID=A0A8S9XHH6_APOLU|nr:hypothetical protein GE061_016899 [Apolygus lucorum]